MCITRLSDCLRDSVSASSSRGLIVPHLNLKLGVSRRVHDDVASPEPLLRPRMPELDTLRGVAILGVLLLHGIYSSTNGMLFEGLARRFIQITQPGWLGVNLFFVLSGFLITGILLDSKSSSRY